jgi:hypothetical protein
MEEKNTFIQSVEEKMKDTYAKIGELKGRAQAEHDISALEAKAAELSKKLEELKGMGEEGWEDLKTSIETGWNDLSDSVKKLFA